MTYACIKDSNQPAYPRSLIRVIVFRINPFKPSGLFYLIPLDRSISNIRHVFFYYDHVLYKYLNLMQTVWTLIRRRVLRRLIWVSTVCQCPFYGTQDLNGLRTLHPCLPKTQQMRIMIRMCECHYENTPIQIH